ncbi:MAG: histidinol-phosphate transaminase [Firmicutes bacterium]|nr:histidinol-phosphate transaminase [Bacillota bacterium]
MIHGGDIVTYRQRSGRLAQDILDCSANLNPLGVPASVMEALSAAMTAVVHYPDPEQREVKAVLAKRFKVAAETILCANGATEAIDLLTRAIRPKRCLILEPAFGEYEMAALRNGSTVVHIPMHVDTERVDFPWGLIESMARQGDLLWINNPHNPLGIGQPFAAWSSHVEELNRRGVQIVVDESFLDFVAEDNTWTAMHDVASMPHLAVIRSATKVFAMPGVRFGFAIVTSPLAEAIARIRDPWSVSSLAQAAAAAAYRDTVYLEQTHSWLAQEQDFVASTWGRSGLLRVNAPVAPYVLARFADDKAAQQVTLVLERDGIFIRDCASFRGLDGAHRRIALKRREDNERVWKLVMSTL